METITSPSTMDRTNRWSTWIVTLLLMLLLYLTREVHWVEWMLYALSCSVYVVVYGNLPTQFILTREEVILDAPFVKKRIGLKEIMEIRPIDKAERKGLIRAWGSSGLFGDWGYYYSPVFRWAKVYVRRRNNWILIVTSGRGKYIIAPDDPSFIHYLNRALLRSR